jgi:hypothetical protein
MRIKRGGAMLAIVAVLVTANSCHRSRNSAISASETSVVQSNGVVIYSPGYPSKQKEKDSSSIRFRVPASQTLSGVLKDPQGAVIANLKLELACAELKKIAQTDYYGKFDLGSIQPGECTITFDPGPWLAPTIKCSAELCTIEPQLTLKRGMNKVIEN